MLFADKPETTVEKEVKAEIEGESFTLTCESDARPDVDGAADYEWTHDGDVIEGATSKTYTIPSLDHTQHDGEYACKTKNALGQGDHGIKATLEIACKYDYIIVDALFLAMMSLSMMGNVHVRHGIQWDRETMGQWLHTRLLVSTHICYD